MLSAGSNTKCGTKVATNTFISAIENLVPMQECGPKEKVMRFASPGCAGARAVAGRAVQRSGLFGAENRTDQ
jgi:hypothetical protein